MTKRDECLDQKVDSDEDKGPKITKGIHEIRESFGKQSIGKHFKLLTKLVMTVEHKKKSPRAIKKEILSWSKYTTVTAVDDCDFKFIDTSPFQFHKKGFFEPAWNSMDTTYVSKEEMWYEAFGWKQVRLWFD